jgi:hypothetical protein
MKKVKNTAETMQSEYDFKGGVRGKYARRYAQGSNIIVLDPDIASAFPDSSAVNEVLRALVKISRKHLAKAVS